MSADRPTKHKARSFSGYRRIHETVMGKLRAGLFVGDDTLTFQKINSDTVRLFGAIGCLGNILITVEKKLLLFDGSDGTPWVETKNYSYNASIQGAHNFLRWDNAHEHPGHIDDHHKHQCDWRTGNDLPGSPVWIGTQHWPTLGRVIIEVRDWYYEYHATLPNPWECADCSKARNA